MKVRSRKNLQKLGCLVLGFFFFCEVFSMKTRAAEVSVVPSLSAEEKPADTLVPSLSADTTEKDGDTGLRLEAPDPDVTVQDTEDAYTAEISENPNLNAGAAKVIDSIDEMSMDEVTQLAALNEEKAEEEPRLKEEYTIVMAKVNESMNIREQPDAGSAKVGLLYADCGGTILETGDGWTKIQSGNLVGWAKNDYLVFGEEACKLMQEVGIYEATVKVSGLRMRKEPNTESGVWTMVKEGDVFQAVKEHTTEDWIAVEYGGALGYLSAEYIAMEYTVDHGETLEEIKEREARERREYQKQIVSEGTSFIGTTDEMLLAALIQCEAGNQPYEGQVAVGAVVINRVNSGAYPNTIAGVIYASGQFTPTKTDKVETLAVSGVKDSCLQAARAAMNGETTVGGATHFRRAGNHDGIVIGDHVFW